MLGAVFFALAFLAIHMAAQPAALANVWFANAAAIAMLATAPRSRWPLLLFTVAVANLAANWALRGNLALSASFVPGNLVEVTMGAWLLQRFDLAREFNASPRAFANAFVAGGMLPQLAGATLGAATLQWYGFASFEGAWLGWYADSLLGALAVLPLALALRQAQRTGTPAKLVTPASLLFLGLTVGVTFAAFWLLSGSIVVVMLPLVACVFFVTTAATFALCFMLILLLCAGFGYGWFQPVFAVGPANPYLLYLPAAATVLPAQLLALVVARMHQLQADTDALTLVGTDTIAVFDRQGVFRGVNRAYERVFGRERKLLIGRSIEEGVDPPFALLARERFEKARSGHVVQLRVERESAIGPRVLDVCYEPVPDADGQIGRVLLSAHDVTALVDVQRELERNVERLRHANEGMQQFVRIASHDMREPLNTIAQFCGLIETDHGHELTPSARLYFEQVGSGTRRMRTLLDDVLSFARLEAGVGVTQQEVALDRTIDTVLAALDASMRRRQARVEVVAPLPVVQGHESLLVLLFQNLVSNAIKFTPPERAPRVRISARDEGDHIVVTVADNGIGIASHDQAQLFTPFKRLHTRRQYDGTGLGLSISRRIVEMFGGAIELESELGVGTQLHVRLRRPEPVAAAVAATAGTPDAV